MPDIEPGSCWVDTKEDAPGVPMTVATLIILLVPAELLAIEELNELVLPKAPCLPVSEMVIVAEVNVDSSEDVATLSVVLVIELESPESEREDCPEASLGAEVTDGVGD